MSDENVSAHNKAIPLGSTFNELFSGGTSVWIKIIGGAVATPVAVIVFALRAFRRGGPELSQNAPELPQNPFVIAAILAAFVVLGAAIGGALSLKDVVASRLAAGRPVAFPIKAMFGFGIWSLLLVWFPAIIAFALVITVLTLGTSVL